MLTGLRKGVCFGVALVMATPLAAENAVFVMSIRGIEAATLTLSGNTNAPRYRVTADVENSGMLGALRRVDYRGVASGRFANGQFQPNEYRETFNSGRRQSETHIVYRNGVPDVLRYTSTREAGPTAPDPATQIGALDPLTTMFAVLRDIKPEQACRQSLNMFDGRRTGRVTMRPAGQKDGLPVCKGKYERLLGFTPKEVSRHTEFDFTMTYRPGPGGLIEVQRIAFNSVYGVAALDRR